MCATFLQLTKRRTRSVAERAGGKATDSERARGAACAAKANRKVGSMKNLSFPGLPRVLVVDDEEGVREGLRALLQAEGLHVETAGSAEDGVRRVEAKSFDIVFLDLNLPGADGLSMLSRLRHGVPP